MLPFLTASAILRGSRLSPNRQARLLRQDPACCQDDLQGLMSVGIFCTAALLCASMFGGARLCPVIP